MEWWGLPGVKPIRENHGIILLRSLLPGSPIPSNLSRRCSRKRYNRNNGTRHGPAGPTIWGPSMRAYLLASLLLFALPVLADAREVVVGVNNAPPYRIIESDHVGGLYIDILNELGARLDWRISYREAPFRRVLWLMEKGQVDLMLGPLKTPQREQYMEFVVQAFPAERRLFFYLDKRNRITRYDDLDDKMIGVLRGSSYYPRFDKDNSLTKVTGTRYENLMRMLAQKHVDVVIAPELVGRYTVEHFNLDLHASPFTTPGEPSWIAISRKSPLIEQADAIREAMEQLLNSPRYPALLRKYKIGMPGDQSGSDGIAQSGRH